MNIIPAEFKYKQEENIDSYIYRICSHKEQIGSWQDVADIINSELNLDYSESAYRKKYQCFQKIFESNQDKFFSNDEYLKEIQKQKDELYKAKRKLADQRREYNKLLTSDARNEHLIENLINAAQRLNAQYPLGFQKFNFETSNKEAVLSIADIHYGMVTDNIWNKYNTKIAKDRLKQLVEKCIPKLMLHKIKTLHVLILGDVANGAIHSSCRVAAEENTNEQLMHISEILAEVINELSLCVEKTLVYSTYGNHMRTIQNKHDSVHSDNMETIIPWWLKQRFQSKCDIQVIDSEFREFIKLNVLGKNIVATHGDLDTFKSFGVMVNTLFSKLYGETIDYTISADKHHLEEFEQFGIESTLVRSLCGSDNYANDKRLYSFAGQTLMIFNDLDGKECTYNIKLD